MNKTELASFYKKRQSEFAIALKQVEKKINLISHLRLLCALVFLASVYFTFTYTFLGYVDVVLLFVFVFLVQKHAKLFEHKVHMENLTNINGNEATLLVDDVSAFVSGTEFIDAGHPYSHDLDIFGEGSLFQYTNRCNTIDGKKQFANRLTTFMSTEDIIQKNQEAIKEIALKTEFRQHFQAAGMQMQEQLTDRAQVLAWVKQPCFLYGQKFYRFGLIIFPLITVGLVVVSFFEPSTKPFAIVCSLIQWALLGFHLKRVNAFHDYIGRKKNILKKYAKLLHFLQREAFTSSIMADLSTKANEADKRVRNLASLVSNFDARSNSLMNFIVNSLFMYDLQCVYRLEKWKVENSTRLSLWLDAISTTEVLNSFGTYAFNNEEFAYAEVLPTLTIHAVALGHPLIKPQERIVNDILVGEAQSIIIVTGANMAGKSTFLRTLGINLVLALNGAPVCATSFQCPIINLRTGMRTADSLKDHKSYFYAELDRLKTIMEELRSNRPLLILLDEILKGTNSTDKQAGSMALVKQLLPHSCLALIATHDLALGQLEDEFPKKIKNFCFEPTIENDQLYFDYKLKSGLAQKMNATFLMKKMGIIPLE